MLKGILVSMEGAYDSLSHMEQRVARYILDHPQDVMEMSVQTLAELSGVSQATIVRLSQSLRCKGFKELKLRIAADLASPSDSSDEYQLFRVGSTTEELIESVTHNNTKSIRDSLSVLSSEMVDQAIARLSSARKIGVFGIGASAVVAEDFKIKVMRINKWCEAGYNRDMQAIIASNLTSQDVVLAISYTGHNPDVWHGIRIAKESGAAVISLTQFGSSPIADLADIQLFTSNLEQHYRIGAMASRIAQLNVVDMLYVGMVTQDYEASIHSLEKTKQAVRPSKS
ncbi:MurR/RpiR family transcriptional regulator [Paenibacillus sp. GCM10023252]|uniref:MurR/RpiR family transcriptional regulator n=1 Tax=Paenibacillus sp. GCM10023252 TaxID=3252649 RepID=UPI003606F8DF